MMDAISPRLARSFLAAFVALEIRKVPKVPTRTELLAELRAGAVRCGGASGCFYPLEVSP
jgi:hypothetical protein